MVLVRWLGRYRSLPSRLMTWAWLWWPTCQKEGTTFCKSSSDIHMLWHIHAMTYMKLPNIVSPTEVSLLVQWTSTHSRKYLVTKWIDKKAGHKVIGKVLIFWLLNTMGCHYRNHRLICRFYSLIWEWVYRAICPSPDHLNKPQVLIRGEPSVTMQNPCHSALPTTECHKTLPHATENSVLW